MKNPLAVRKVVETGVYVTDLDAARDFYTRVLGLELYSSEPNRHVFLKAGKSMLLLFLAATTLQEKRLPAHGASGIQHFAFEIDDADYDSWKARLSREGVAITKEVNWGKARSVYFDDPSGNVVELITKGNWPVDD
ncbi:MAG: VOC family protein [Nitrososphaerales archaeon]|nr:VOC family protein [Nitrososphaerales archaeon]